MSRAEHYGVQFRTGHSVLSLVTYAPDWETALQELKEDAEEFLEGLIGWIKADEPELYLTAPACAPANVWLPKGPS